MISLPTVSTFMWLPLLALLTVSTIMFLLMAPRFMQAVIVQIDHAASLLSGHSNLECLKHAPFEALSGWSKTAPTQ